MPQSPRISVEDLWKIKRPGGLSLSPDGSQAVCSLTAYDMDENTASTQLWLLSTFGGKPRRLTVGGEKDGQPAWSPDGTRIAFVAKRKWQGKDDDEPQLYLIDPDGGEAQRLTDLATGVHGIKWFPDGKRLAFISWVWPDGGGRKKQAERLKEHKASKVKAHVVEHSLHRFWDHWLSDGRVPHLFVADAASGKCEDLFEGTPYEVVRADEDETVYDIAPDGRSLVFAYDPAPEKRLDDEFDLVELELKGRRFRNLTESSTLHFDKPVYAPDGGRIACLSYDLRKSHTAAPRLTLLDRADGSIEVASAKWDRGVNAPLVWSEASDAVFFTAEDEARQHVVRFDLAAKKAEVVVAGGTVMRFARADGVLAYVRTDMDTPPAVYARIEDEGGQIATRKIEDFNDALMKPFRFGTVEEVRFPGFNGETAHMWLIFPPDFNPKKKYPLLHSIHGGPHAAASDSFHFRWNNHLFAAQGYIVACVNYHGSSSFGQKYLESINRDWGRRELADVEAATDLLLQRPYVDKKRLFATGGSYGGYMVAWMNGKLPAGRYRAYVCHAGCFDWTSMFADDAFYWYAKELGAWYWEDFKKVESQNPRAFVANMATPTLVIHGALDYRVPDTQALQYYNTLKAKGVPTRLVYFPDENHWILKPQNSRLWYREFFDWLKRFDAK
jgi:dipeptidyl aminopeptidase/acylaminoacyl peptidase